MKAKTKKEEEIINFKEFIKDVLESYDKGRVEPFRLFGELTFSSGLITYKTSSGIGKYTLDPILGVLFFDGRRHSFDDGTCSTYGSFHPQKNNWEITETSRPDLALGEFNDDGSKL